MDITVEYTDEEKRLFDEVQKLKERIHILEDEEFLLRREKQEHLMVNHTDGRTPAVCIGISLFCWFIFAVDLIVGFEFQMIHFAAAITFASAAPVCAIIFLVLFIVTYRRYYYQVIQTDEGKKKAAELNIKNYYAEEDRIDTSYNKVMVELARLKEVYRRKEKELDEIVVSKEMKTNKQREEEIKARNAKKSSEAKPEKTEEKSGIEEKKEKSEK